MKTSADPRHLRRREIVKVLFAESFNRQASHSNEVKRILDQREALDAEIAKAAPAWPTEKLNKIDLAILRLAVYELSNSATPPKVVIDEAVELGKEFGAESSPSFINGVLGTIYKGAGMKITAERIKELLAEQIGVEPEDLNEEDSFTEDLHMTNADLTDFAHKLEGVGVDPAEIDFTSAETIGELIEALGIQVE